MRPCSICDNEDYLRCGCESQQPYCDQCSEDNSCTSKMDTDCVFYHLITTDNPTPPPSKLINLGISNNSSLTEILEALDKLIGTNFNIPFAPLESESVEWEPGGPAGHKPKAKVKISEDLDNQLELHDDGLYVPSGTSDYKVKVNAADTPDYLEDQIEGADDGYVFITTAVVGGVLQIIPALDTEALTDLICQACASASPSGGPGCAEIETFGAYAFGTPSNGLVRIPVTVVSSGQVTVTITTANGSIFGSITLHVPEGDSFINVPIFYDGGGASGIQTLDIAFDGFTNTVACEVDVDVVADEDADCVPVTLAGSPSLPDVSANAAYNYVIGLNGTAPFNLTDVIKPAWMSIAIVGSTVVFSGTPSGADAGIDIDVSFIVHNCADAEDTSFSDELSVTTVDALNLSSATTFSVSGIPGFTFGSPLVGSGGRHGIHTAFTGAISITVSATGGGGLSGSMSLFKNGVLVSCSPIGAPGGYSFPSTTFLATDVIQVRWGPFPSC